MVVKSDDEKKMCFSAPQPTQNRFHMQTDIINYNNGIMDNQNATNGNVMHIIYKRHGIMSCIYSFISSVLLLCYAFNM